MRVAARRTSCDPSSSSAGLDGASLANFVTLPSSISSGEPMQLTPWRAAAFLRAAPLNEKGSAPSFVCRSPWASLSFSRQMSTPFSPLMARPRSLLFALSLATVNFS